MLLSDLLRREVRTESGRQLGRVHDVRAERRGRKLLVTGVIVGRRAALEHFGIGLSGRTGHKVRTDVDVIPWTAIVRIAGDALIVKDGTD